MKQSELDKLVAASLRTHGRELDWRAIGQILYKHVDRLFYVLVVGTGARERSLHWSLRVKWADMDSELWRVLGMHSNLDRPASLRANGAFTLFGEEVAWRRLEECEWTSEAISQITSVIVAEADGALAEVREQIQSLDQFMSFAREQHARLLLRSPKAAVTLWKEEVLFHLLKGERALALDIARQRISVADTGSIISNENTFFEHAKRYAEVPV